MGSDEDECYDEEEEYEEEEEDCDDPDHDEDTSIRFDSFVQHLINAGFKPAGWGSFRRTYIRGNVVIKVPRNPDGVIDNLMEAKAWRKYRSEPTDQGIYLAPCRLLPNGALMMVAIEHLAYDDKPHWSSTIDCNQVGRYKDRVVAYDFALDLSERHKWEKELSIEPGFFQHTWLYRKPYLRHKEDKP